MLHGIAAAAAAAKVPEMLSDVAAKAMSDAAAEALAAVKTLAWLMPLEQLGASVAPSKSCGCGCGTRPLLDEGRDVAAEPAVAPPRALVVSILLAVETAAGGCCFFLLLDSRTGKLGDCNRWKGAPNSPDIYSETKASTLKLQIEERSSQQQCSKTAKRVERLMRSLLHVRIYKNTHTDACARRHGHTHARTHARTHAHCMHGIHDDVTGARGTHGTNRRPSIGGGSCVAARAAMPEP